MDEIVEQIIERLEGVVMKDTLLFEYVDSNIDEWDIDIGDHFLDDIMELVCPLLKKRARLSKQEADDGIVFKEDEEQAEKIQLKVVVKKYDILYREACEIDEVEDLEEDEEDATEGGRTPAGSWKDVLDRIDAMRNKMSTHKCLIKNNKE